MAGMIGRRCSGQRPTCRSRHVWDSVLLLAKRQLVERANAGFAQCGGKVAHRFGKDHVEFDATLSALTHNLRTLGRLVARRPLLRRQLDQRIKEDDRRGQGRLLFLCLLLACARSPSSAPASLGATIVAARALALLVRYARRTCRGYGTRPAATCATG